MPKVDSSKQMEHRARELLGEPGDAVADQAASVGEPVVERRAPSRQADRNSDAEIIRRTPDYAAGAERACPLEHGLPLSPSAHLSLKDRLIRSSEIHPPASAERIARFEELGEDDVRDLVEEWQWPLSCQGRAWLKTKREAAAGQEQALKLEQAAVVRRALILAIAASITAIAALVLSVTAWLFPMEG